MHSWLSQGRLPAKQSQQCKKMAWNGDAVRAQVSLKGAQAHAHPRKARRLFSLSKQGMILSWLRRAVELWSSRNRKTGGDGTRAGAGLMKRLQKSIQFINSSIMHVLVVLLFYFLLSHTVRVILSLITERKVRYFSLVNSGEKMMLPKLFLLCLTLPPMQS